MSQRAIWNVTLPVTGLALPSVYGRSSLRERGITYEQASVACATGYGSQYF